MPLVKDYFRSELLAVIGIHNGKHYRLIEAADSTYALLDEDTSIVEHCPLFAPLTLTNIIGSTNREFVPVKPQKFLRPGMIIYGSVNRLLWC